MEQQHKAGQPVLVIDDSDIDRARMCELIEAAGYEVHALASPIGATRTARQLQVRAVVIDQNLPAMDGSKLAALSRGNLVMRNIRIVLTSGTDDPAMRKLAESAAIDAFLTKSEMHRELVATIKRLLG